MYEKGIQEVEKNNKKISLSSSAILITAQVNELDGNLEVGVGW